MCELSCSNLPFGLTLALYPTLAQATVPFNPNLSVALRCTLRLKD